MAHIYYVEVSDAYEYDSIILLHTQNSHVLVGYEPNVLLKLPNPDSALPGTPHSLSESICSKHIRDTNSAVSACGGDSCGGDSCAVSAGRAGDL